MKKVLAFIMALLAIVALPTISFADEVKEDTGVIVKENVDYGFSFTEYIDYDHDIIRTYQKQEATATEYARRSYSDQLMTSEEKTKSILADLGMSPVFINELTAEDLEAYAQSLHITSIVTYTKTDADGNVVKVPKEEAIAVAAVSPDFSYDDGDDLGGGAFPTYTGIETDSYMKLTLVVSYRGDGLYKFSIDGEWLTMPAFRCFDMLSIYSPYTTVEHQTIKGWSCFDMRVTSNGQIISGRHKELFVDGENGVEMQAVLNANQDYCGAAVVFNLPEDAYVPYCTVIYSNYVAHLEYEGYMNNLSDAQRFNVVGRYDHTRYILSEAPAVTVDIGLSPIGIGLTFTPSLGIELEEVVDTRTVNLPASIEYTP